MRCRPGMASTHLRLTGFHTSRCACAGGVPGPAKSIRNRRNPSRLRITKPLASFRTTRAPGPSQFHIPSPTWVTGFVVALPTPGRSRRRTLPPPNAPPVTPPMTAPVPVSTATWPQSIRPWSIPCDTTLLVNPPAAPLPAPISTPPPTTTNAEGSPVAAPTNPPARPPATAPPAAAPLTPPKVIGRPVRAFQPTYPTTPTPAPINAPAPAAAQLHSNPLGSSRFVGRLPRPRYRLTSPAV